MYWCGTWKFWGSVVECLTRDRGTAGSSLTGITVLWSLTRHIYPSLVLVQPRKTPPCLTERLSMGRKESNQTNKHKEILSKDQITSICQKQGEDFSSLRVEFTCTCTMSIHYDGDFFLFLPALQVLQGIKRKSVSLAYEIRFFSGFCPKSN